MIEIVDRLDPSLCWSGGALGGPEDIADEASLRDARGAFAWVRTLGRDRYQVVRDPLGINKIFWAATEDGRLSVAARLLSLVRTGYGLDQIRAWPRNHVVEVSSGRVSRAERIRDVEPSETDARDVEDIAKGIRSKLDDYLSTLCSRFGSSETFICLSGGLDSTGVAALAREHFPNLVAVTFDLKRPGGPASEDRVVAERVATDLDMPLFVVDVGEEELLEKLDDVLVEGMDWRDFNVHAALVNACLADAIGSSSNVPKGPVLVLTGDLSNEFLADYEPEQYGNRAFYTLPRLDRSRLRRWLVDGVASTHREVGIFASFGLTVAQPYAVAAEEYMMLPPDFLEARDRKQRLMRLVCGDRVPDYVHSRSKVRAQVGDPRMSGGVLALCVDRGIDGPELKRRFARLHGITDTGSLDRFMRAGRYRTGMPTGDPS